MYLIDYRRHHLVKRALVIVVAQTYRDLTVTGSTDDAADQEVDTILAAGGNRRISIFGPHVKWGAAQVFKKHIFVNGVYRKLEVFQC